MIEIEYKGGNSVVIATKSLKLKVDPKLSALGLKDLNTKDAIELATEPRFLVNNPEAHLVIEGPGEYEVGSFSVRGVAASRHIDTDAKALGTTIYRIDVGEVRIALFGNVAPDLSEDQLEAIGIVDIAIVPVGGGGYTLDHVAATKLVRQIDPRVVIPVHYAETGLAYEVPQDSPEAFISDLGMAVETVDKYKLKSASALPGTMTTVVVKRS